MARLDGLARAAGIVAERLLSQAGAEYRCRRRSRQDAGAPSGIAD